MMTPEELSELSTDDLISELVTSQTCTCSECTVQREAARRLRAAETVEVDYWCHFDDKGRAIRVHDGNSVHMDGCTRMYVRRSDVPS